MFNGREIRKEKKVQWLSLRHSGKNAAKKILKLLERYARFSRKLDLWN